VHTHSKFIQVTYHSVYSVNYSVIEPKVVVGGCCIIENALFVTCLLFVVVMCFLNISLAYRSVFMFYAKSSTIWIHTGTGKIQMLAQEDLLNACFFSTMKWHVSVC
jgi:hypothetical protein